MENPIVNSMITALIGLASGAILAYIGAVLKFRKDLEAEYDKDLRAKRIEVYKDLWNHLGLLARYDRPKALNRKTLKELSVAMRDWYFGVGGLYLSEEARKSYFDLKEMIKNFIEGPQTQKVEDSDPALQAMLAQASLLRSHLTRDVGTRKSSPIANS